MFPLWPFQYNKDMKLHIATCTASLRERKMSWTVYWALGLLFYVLCQSADNILLVIFFKTCIKQPGESLMLILKMCLHSIWNNSGLKHLRVKIWKEIQHQKGVWTMTELRGQWIKDQENSGALWVLQSCAADTGNERSYLKETDSEEC